MQVLLAGSQQPPALQPRPGQQGPPNVPQETHPRLALQMRVPEPRQAPPGQQSSVTWPQGLHRKLEAAHCVPGAEHQLPLGGGQHAWLAAPQNPEPPVLQEPGEQAVLVRSQQTEPVLDPTQSPPGLTHTRTAGTSTSHPQQLLPSQALPGQQRSPLPPQGMQTDSLPTVAQTASPTQPDPGQQAWPVASGGTAVCPQARQVPATQVSDEALHGWLEQQGSSLSPQAAHFCESSRHTAPLLQELALQQGSPMPPQQMWSTPQCTEAHCVSAQQGMHPMAPPQSFVMAGQLQVAPTHSLPPLQETVELPQTQLPFLQASALWPQGRLAPHMHLPLTQVLITGSHAAWPPHVHWPLTQSGAAGGQSLVVQHAADGMHDLPPASRHCL